MMAYSLQSSTDGINWRTIHNWSFSKLSASSKKLAKDPEMFYQIIFTTALGDETVLWKKVPKSAKVPRKTSDKRNTVGKAKAILLERMEKSTL